MRLNLLLLLTALFASLTGGGAGERAVRQVQGVSVARAAEVAQAVVPAQRVQPAAHAVVPSTATAPAWHVAPAHALPVARLPFERRLE